MNPLDWGRHRHIGAWSWSDLKPGPSFPYIAYILWGSAIPFSRDTYTIGSAAQIRQGRRK